MSEVKVVIFDTRYKAVGGSFSIFLQREIEYENVLEVDLNLSTSVDAVNNKQIIPGNLSMISKNQLSSGIDLYIDKNGHLIVSGEDANNYSLNEEGHLIYTYR